MVSTVLPPPQTILQRFALLLDVDGTLLDIAPTPESVIVPPELPTTLRRLHRALGGALAIISGRPLDQIDRLFGNAFPAAAEHGAVLRIPPAAARRLALPDVPAAWRDAAETLARQHPGVRIEAKTLGFVVHYRGAPEAGPMLEHALDALLRPEEKFEVMPADMALEVRPRGADKGTAVAAVMAAPAFAGRLPLFIGDDVTDLDGIRATEALGGIGLRVHEAFGSPASVRAWLGALRELHDAPAS